MSGVRSAPPELVDQLQEQKALLEPHLNKAKCEWPLAIMEKIHEIAGQITKVVGKELYEAIEFPDAKSSHPEGFYPGASNIDKAFTRPKLGWFENHGYKMHKTTYTYGNRWDRVPITAAFYVPKNLEAGDEAPIIWFFHGGGYCTGANDFVPWFSKASIAHAYKKKAIIIAPDYPLGPEGNYKDIVDALNDFLDYYKKDICFEKGYSKWTEWLLSKIGTKGVTLKLKRVLVEGESAGGQAAATALFLNADKKTGARIDISAALLRYPMIEHYARDIEEFKYMGQEFPREDLEKKADAILTARDALEDSGHLPTRVRSAPPQCMSAAFILSVLGRWKGSFQRAHPDQDLQPLDTMDALERAKNSADKVDHAYLPPLYMYHGADDSNCKPGKTQEFEEVLREKYPTRYTDGSICTRIVEGMRHAFDYEFEEGEHDFLKKTYEDVDGHW